MSEFQIGITLVCIFGGVNIIMLVAVFIGLRAALCELRRTDSSVTFWTNKNLEDHRAIAIRLDETNTLINDLFIYNPLTALDELDTHFRKKKNAEALMMVQALQAQLNAPKKKTKPNDSISHSA